MKKEQKEKPETLFSMLTWSIKNTILVIMGFYVFAYIIVPVLPDYDFKTFTNPDDYKKALKYVCHPKKTKHFPKEIPSNTKNVKLYKPNDCWFGSDSFSLYLESDKNFITDSFRGINCIETEGPFLKEDEYKYHIARNKAVENVNISKEGLMFCVIDSYGESEESGIAVDYKNNRILFYSILLD